MLVLVLTAGSAPASAAELPDLEQVAPYKVRVAHRDGRWYLGFATAVRNVGAGALRIRGQRSDAGKMAAAQVSEDGLAVLNPAVGTLRYVTTYGHHHWHFMRFMRYELRGMDIPGRLLDRKQGFCLGDAPFVIGWCGRDQPALSGTEQGIRPGGTDIYEPNVEGQEIVIDRDSAPSGRYVLTSRIGPTGRIRETRTDNNVASTVIELRWPMRDGQEVGTIAACLGEGCAGPIPRAPTAPRRMSAADGRRLARRALRRTAGWAPARIWTTCRRAGRHGRACRVGLVRRRAEFSGTVRVWYELEGAATRWYYTLDVVRRVSGCQQPGECSRRIRRSDRRGGTVGRR